MDLLKLIALDHEDMEIVSAHLQDALVKVADVHWRPADRRLAALRFDRVLACKCKNVQPQDKDAILNLLAVEFTETSAPAGVITLTCSGGATLRLEVECQ